MKTFSGIDELAAAAGTDLGATDWITITQDQVNTFADATGDHQWIHVDPVRAATGPFGGTIAHGFLTLSLLPVLLAKLYRVENIAMGLNYGLGKVRFPTSVPVGSKLRARASIAEATRLDGAVQVIFAVTFEIDGVSKPACVAESIIRFFG